MPPLILAFVLFALLAAIALTPSWHAWQVAPDYGSWVAASGAAGSLAAGAVVLGFYLTYWLGVRRRLRRHTWIVPMPAAE